MTKKCEVCNGGGDYPIIDNFGSTRYSITCPECFGSGEEIEEPAPEPSDLPPASSAAFIKSMDDLRDHVAKHWRYPQESARD